MTWIVKNRSQIGRYNEGKGLNYRQEREYTAQNAMKIGRMEPKMQSNCKIVAKVVVETAGILHKVQLKC